MLLTKIKQWLARYDAWCEDLGLTPEHKRSCCTYRPEPTHEKKTTDKHDVNA